MQVMMPARARPGNQAVLKLTKEIPIVDMDTRKLVLMSQVEQAFS